MLRDVQGFDPNGVGGKGPIECLLLQLKFLGRSQMGFTGAGPGVPERVGAGSDRPAPPGRDLEKKQYNRIAKALNISMDDVFEATRIIEGLEPKPGVPFQYAELCHCAGCLRCQERRGGEVLLNDDGLPRMRISPYYKQLMSSGQSGSAETKAYLDDKPVRRNGSSGALSSAIRRL